jgi:hypothetical protein
LVASDSRVNFLTIRRAVPEDARTFPRNANFLAPANPTHLINPINPINLINPTNL